MTAEQYLRLRKERTPHVLLDVRGQDEWNEGHVEHAILMPHWFVALKAKEVAPDLSIPVVVYCASGARSAVAAAALDKLGYEDIRNIVDGYPGLHAAGA